MELHSLGADLEALTADGRTPMYIASSIGHLSIVNYLLESGALANTSTHFGWTPTFVATIRGHFKVVEALLNARKDNLDGSSEK